MATGEYTSVRSQGELTQAEIAVERREIARSPEAEERELALLYQSRGVSPDLATRVAHELHKNDEVAWRIHAREELGLDPDDLPSPWTAAGSSFLAFAAGALIPLIPFLFGLDSVTVAVVLTGLALFATGAVVARLTARPAWYGGARQFLLGGAAAAVTFGVGHVFGAVLS
jgi:VIT1/CCC1 family predicted Fe2+/Mn2+ transporter